MPDGREGSKTGFRIVDWLRPFLLSRRLPLFLAALATVLAIPSLWGGWVADDHHHRLRLTTEHNFLTPLGSPTDLFRFADASEEQNHKLMDIGIWPWWTLPNLKAAFWRPITSWTHWLDYRVWPDNPVPMHAHSILWLAALAGAAALLFRRMLGVTLVAGLAALLYAIDDARAMPVGFLSNRNALISGVFGICAIIVHDRWRRDGWRAGAILSPCLFAVGLLSAEAGIGAAGYLIAYALFLERGPWRSRLFSLVPYLAVIVAWRTAWSMLGYGIWGIGIYVDPLLNPLRFLVELPPKMLALLLGQFLLPPSEVYLLAADQGLQLYYVVFVAVAAMLVLRAIYRRVRWDATMKFWACGMLFSLIPACSAFPADRMLTFAGLGAFALISGVLVDGVTPGRKFRKTLLVVHLGIAPLLLAVRSWMPVGPPGLLEKIQIPPTFDQSIEEQSLVVVTAPVSLLASWLPEQCILGRHPAPAHTRVLAPYFSGTVEVRRPDERTLLIHPRRGFLNQIADIICRDPNVPMALGQRVELTGMTAEVMTLTDDGRPDQVAFRFDVPLEDGSLRWLNWNGTEFAPYTPPAVGGTVVLGG